MLVSQILKEKGDVVFTVSCADSVAAVAALLLARRVGAMVVLDEAGDVAGIVSERDIVRIVAESGADGLAQAVSTCMTRDVVFAEPMIPTPPFHTDKEPDAPPACRRT